MKAKLIIYGIGICFLASCGGNSEEYTLRLTANERTRIDTLYAAQVGRIRAEVDSICDLQRDSLIERALDSIIKERLEEEVLLRSRLPMPEDTLQ